ncbi:hypothetical protein AALP_AAs62360U000100 [Arabis alpina]|uniref:Uncharacterized protein n=1 Tax=Arabis alpina TaxID=50452 RepID=A0A087FW89_ARAAL|nr:hypothetical protein AALP_AAs62360U000100 [Arabis alpina]
MTLAISTRSQAAKQAKVADKTKIKDVEMTEAEADTELAPSTTAPAIEADVTRADDVEADVVETNVPEADSTEAEVPDDLGQPKDPSSQNLPLEPKGKGTTIPMDMDDEPEYGCDKPWLDQIRAYIVDGELPKSKWAARKRDKRPDKSWKKYTTGSAAITQEAKPWKSR